MRCAGLVARRWALAAGSLAGDAVIVDGVDGALVAKLADHPFGVGRVAWSPDGTRLAIGGQDGIVRLYDRDATILGEHDAGLGGWVGALAWSPSGGCLAVGAGRALTLLEPDGGLVHRYPDEVSTVTAVAWSADSTRVGVAAYGGVRWYDPDKLPVAPATRHFVWKGSLLSLVVSPDGKWAVGGAQDNSVHLWKLWSGDDMSMSGYPAKVEHVAFSANSRWLAVGNVGEVTVWDFSRKGPAGTAPAMGEGHTRHVECLAWRPDGAVLATGGGTDVLLWPAPTKKGQRLQPLARLDGQAKPSALAWHPAGTRLAVARADGGVDCVEVT